MRSPWSPVLAFALIVGFADSTPAQTELRGPGPTIGGFHLITMPAVQRELKLDEGQVAKAQKVAERMNARFNQDMGKMKGLNADERAKRVVTLAGPHYDEGMRELRAFLSPAQVDRFDQILFQLRGPMAMLEPKIAPALKVTNEQAQQVAALVVDTQREQQAAVREVGQDRQAAAVKMEAIASRANEKAAALLSPEQRKTWGRLVGEPFRPDFAGGDAAGSDRAATPKS